MIANRRVHAPALAMLAAMAAALPGHAEERTSLAPAACRPDGATTGTVGVVTDGRTLTLVDGREVRLAAIEVPDLRPANGDSTLAGAAARAALAALTDGKELVLKHLGSPDRYGRTVAHIFAGDGPEAWVQKALVAGGHALVSPHAGDKSCAAVLLAAERDARARKLGLWNNSFYDIRGANDPLQVLADRGRFTLVEGKVVSVRESGGTTYINFGRRWSEDFTVTILKRYDKVFTAVGMEPKTLAGRRIRVRGFVEQRGGPWIEATTPEQIEIVTGD